MTDSLSLTFQALADPTRRALLRRLSKGDFSVSELAEPFLKDMSLPAITKHLQVLEKAGLIQKSRQAQWRQCRMDGRPLKEIADWMDFYRQHWEESFVRLDAYLKTMTAAPVTKGRKNVKRQRKK